jgi:hypothetical protein
MVPGTSISLPPLKKKSMIELIANARRMGIEPADYAVKLIEDGLSLQSEAENSTFAQIMKPVREAAGEVDDLEITRLVDSARAEHHAGSRRKKR